MPENDDHQQQQPLDSEQAQHGQQAEVGPNAPAPEARNEALDRVLMLVDTMSPGDEQHLVTLLRRHPEYQAEILAHAQSVVGNQTVVRAQELLATPDAPVAPEPAPEAPPPRGNDQGILFSLQILEQGQADELASILRNHPEMFDQIVAEAEQYVGKEACDRAVAMVRGAPPQVAEQPEPTPPAEIENSATEHAGEAATVAPEPTQESGWVVRARAYNAHHPDDVSQFNQLTQGACIGADGQIDPNLIATWQAGHGVAPDGRVGNETIAAAQTLNPEPAQQAQVPEPEPEQPPAE